MEEENQAVVITMLRFSFVSFFDRKERYTKKLLVLDFRSLFITTFRFAKILNSDIKSSNNKIF